MEEESRFRGSFAPWQLALRFGGFFGRHFSLKLVYLSCITGAAAGLVAVAFAKGLDWAVHFNMEVMAGHEVLRPAGEPSHFALESLTPRNWLFFILPILGGLVSGWLVYKLAPEAEGHGTDAVLDAFHNKAGRIRKRIPIIKGISSIITLSTGGSAGKEGPIAQIGAGVGSWLGDIFRLTPREKRILLLAGVSGGIGSIFRAPLGGALFGVEVLYKEDFETDAIIPCIFSSVVAYSVLMVFYGTEPIFHIPDIAFTNWRALFFYLLLGLVCALIGPLYVKIFYGMRDLFAKIPIANVWKPAIGGFGVALVGLALPQTLGGGYGWLQLAIMGGISIPLALAIAMGKIVTTSFTISSGGSGGVFAPSLFIGGMLGSAVGGFAQYVSPELVPDVAPFVLVGMAAFFSGIANTPISALIMVSEMTEGYALLAPLMLISVFVISLQRKFCLYEKQVPTRLESPAHLADFSIDVFAGLKVREIMRARKVTTIQESSTVHDILQLLKKCHDTFFPVVNKDNRYVGILEPSHLREFLLDPDQEHLLIARDLMSSPVSLDPEEDGHLALNKFLSTGYGQIPVMKAGDEKEILGVLSHEDLAEAYDQEIARRKASS